MDGRGDSSWSLGLLWRQEERWSRIIELSCVVGGVGRLWANIGIVGLSKLHGHIMTPEKSTRTCLCSDNCTKSF